jgi:hypothetical protein
MSKDARYPWPPPWWPKLPEAPPKPQPVKG